MAGKAIYFDWFVAMRNLVEVYCTLPNGKKMVDFKEKPLPLLVAFPSGWNFHLKNPWIERVSEFIHLLIGHLRKIFLDFVFSQIPFLF